MRIHKTILLPLFLTGILMVSPFIGINPLIATAATAQENSTSVSSSGLTNSNSLSISDSSSGSDIEKRMVDISSSDTPGDIATLAYIWGFPLVTMERFNEYYTSPDSIAKGINLAGPENNITFARQLITANDTGTVTPNADTLYGYAFLNMTSEPIVLQMPPIEPDRYYSFQLMDAYTNNYQYLGTRATGSEGGTYLIAGPNWEGTVPEGMTKIWSPTDLTMVLNRILIKGPSDTPNVKAIQDRIKVMPLSAYLSNSAAPASTSQPSNTTAMTNESDAQVPISPRPPFIPTTGIKIYDEISAAMTVNPLNPPDPTLVKKLASIGIGPGMTPSTQANGTIKSALQTGITEGEKLINAKVANFGANVNGWTVNAATGLFGTDYLFRAATVVVGVGANTGQEAIYPVTFVDSEGKLLTGDKNYTVHFEPGQLPPVNSFWSLTIYNNQSLFVDNPINRYLVGQYTEGLKNNTDGSLDIYIQNTNPGPDKESNWLPAPSAQVSDKIKLVLRLYLPDDSILNGTWSPPPVIRSE